MKAILVPLMLIISVMLISGCTTQECVTEGESGPVYPGYQCCEGLTPIGCAQPDENGTCESDCVGAFFCTKCGDGECMDPENVCNCPRDCGAESAGNIFVTNDSFRGNLGGLEGADEKCSAAAAKAGFKGIWIALISTSEIDADQRIPDITFESMKGFGVASGRNDLFDGTLLNPILTEAGEEFSGTVWTGTYAYPGDAPGIFTGDDCNGWTDGNATGTTGKANYMDANWMEWNLVQSCSIESSIYCVRAG